MTDFRNTLSEKLWICINVKWNYCDQNRTTLCLNIISQKYILFMGLGVNVDGIRVIYSFIIIYLL